MDDFRVSFAVEVRVVNIFVLNLLDPIKTSVEILCSQIISKSQVQLLTNNLLLITSLDPLYFVDHANSKRFTGVQMA